MTLTVLAIQEGRLRQVTRSDLRVCWILRLHVPELAIGIGSSFNIPPGAVKRRGVKLKFE